MDDLDDQQFRKRSGFIIAAVLLWAFFCFVGVVWFSVIQQKQYRKKALETAWFQSSIPALRGTIYASDGTVLASSKFEFFLFWKKDKVKTAVESLFGRNIINGGEISEKELSLLDPVFKKYPSAIWVETRERRTSEPGIEHLEQKYDDVLRGENGLFAVMHDRYGRRVPGSLKVVKKQVHGKHVTLKPGEEKHEQR